MDKQALKKVKQYSLTPDAAQGKATAVCSAGSGCAEPHRMGQNPPWPGCAILWEGAGGAVEQPLTSLAAHPAPRSCQEAPLRAQGKSSPSQGSAPAVLFCQIFLNVLPFVLSCSGTFQGLPEKLSSSGMLWEWKAALHLSVSQC